MKTVHKLSLACIMTLFMPLMSKALSVCALWNYARQPAQAGDGPNTYRCASSTNACCYYTNGTTELYKPVCTSVSYDSRTGIYTFVWQIADRPPAYETDYVISDTSLSLNPNDYNR